MGVCNIRSKLHVRSLSKDEEETLKEIIDAGSEAAYRAKIILLSSQGYSVLDIAKMINLKPDHIRAWIHRFNEKGIDGLKDRPMVRSLTQDEKKELEVIDRAKCSISYRAKIILLSNKLYNVKEIAHILGINEFTVSNWIYKFNALGINGIKERRRYTRSSQVAS
ncbi:MAG: helix-turn-helix domain-containing protein [Nitrososphaerales archaeon]